MTETAEKRRRLGGREATAAQIPGAYAISVGDTGAPLPKGWKRHLLSDLARMESGHTPSRRHPEYWGGNIPWIGIRDATGNHGRTIYETNENTNALGIANSASRVLPKDTVCLSRTASVGYVVVMGREMATSQDFANWICGPDLDYRYLKYALIAEGDALLNFASGSVHQTIYFPELKSFHIAAPGKPEQSAIAEILSALDDKIELNRQTNETLEGMAQAIFRDWFVDFGPTRRKAAGEADPVAIMGGLTPDPARAAELAALFPAAFGDDGLPVGWSRRTVESIMELAYGKALPKTVRKDGPYPVYGSGGISGTHSSPLTSGPGIIVGRKGTVGSLYWEAGDFFAIDTVFYVVPKDGVQLNFAWYLLQTLGLENMNTDAAVPGLNRGNAYRLEFAYGGAPLLEAFEALVGPLRARQNASNAETQTLAETRDYLLPRLMSGAVRVAPKVEAA